MSLAYVFHRIYLLIKGVPSFNRRFSESIFDQIRQELEVRFSVSLLLEKLYSILDHPMMSSFGKGDSTGN
jgi:hypothetical protein